MSELEIIQKDKYEEIGKFCIGLARVKRDGKYGFINEAYEEVCPPKYDMALDFDVSTRIAKVRLNDKFGFINEKCEEVCPPIYDLLIPWNGWRLYLVKLNGEYNSININGEKLNSVPYTKVSPAVKGKAMVKANGKYAYINGDLKEITPFKYSVIRFKFHMLCWRLGLGKKE